MQRIEAELTSFAGGAGISTLTADDAGYGFNLGLMAKLSPATRLGFSYRSKIKYDLEGTVAFSVATPGNGNVSADLKVPESYSLSVFHVLNPKWELMGDITRTGWDSLQQLRIVRTSGPGTGTVLSTLVFNWDDTWRYGVGANYKWSDQTKLRFGLALDKTPTNDVDRTPRLPDQDRTWLAFGVQHRVSKAPKRSSRGNGPTRLTRYAPPPASNS